MTRQEMLLAVLSAANGRAYTPVQIQKATFLISRNLPGLISEGPTYAFQPYDYGPFDVQVYQDADALEQEGLAEIRMRGRYKVYLGSDVGVERGQEVLHNLREGQRDYIAAVCKWVRELSFEQLVKAIYDSYPEMRVNSIFQG